MTQEVTHGTTVVVKRGMNLNYFGRTVCPDNRDYEVAELFYPKVVDPESRHATVIRCPDGWESVKQRRRKPSAAVGILCM